MVAATLLATGFAAPAAAATTPGAPVPFTEYNAGTGGTGVATNGTILGPDYDFGTLPSEATGRMVDQLVGQGSYVSFTLTAPANAVDFHYAIPDSLSGGGITAPLDLYVNNTLTTALSMTSQYSWLYGPYTFTSDPSVGEADTDVPHDFYNDVRYMFGSTLPAGTVVKLQVDSGDTSPWYAINTADFETVAAPIAQPAGSINVTQAPYDVDNSGVTDVTTALQNAIDAAETSGQTLYLPQGTYTISQQLFVNDVTIIGAGEWYTEMTGTNVEFAGQIAPASTNVNISNLSIFGDINVRNDGDGEVNGFNGGFSNSTFSNVWIQNTKVGAWIVGPSTGLTLNNLRIQDTTADGVNFNAADGAITGDTVENTFLRNTQDDGLAMWAENYGDTNDTFTQNTVDSPGLANNVGIYGDVAGSVISNNLLQDTITRGGGIGIGARFGSTTAAGTLTVSGNELVRTGQFDPGWNYGVGAIWFWPQTGNLAATVDITGNTILDSPYEAFQFQNESGFVGTQVTTPPSSGDTVTNVDITNNTVTNVGTFVFQDQAPGSISVSGTTATGVGDAGVFSCGSGFTVTQGSGNSGWSSTACGMPTSSPLWIYPSTTTFENATVGQATPTQQIAVMNTAAATATLGAIAASSGFTVSQDPNYPCGSSLQATLPATTGPWCMVDVSFTASAAGITKGTLTVPTNQPGPDTVQLIGSTGGTQVNTPPTITPSSLSFGSETVGSTTAAQTATVNNPGTSAITISSIVTTGQFSQTNTCGSSLAAGASCTVAVKFAPTSVGAQTGTLAVTNSATGSPIGVTLSGTATAAGPALTISPASLSFPATFVGSSPAAQTVTVSNTGTTSATVSGVAATGDFSQTDNCSTIAVGASCTVTVTFKPTTGGSRTGTLTVTSNANNSPTTASLSGTGISLTTNLALTGTMTASTTDSGFPATNANDGNTSSYWESNDGSAYPQTLTANLGSSYPLSSVTLDLPPSTAWSTRTETLSVLGSTNGTSWTTLVPSATYTFNPATGNTVSFNLPSGTTDQYLELSFTANSGWTAAQLSEFEIFPGSGGGGTPTATLAASPTSLSFGSQTVGSTSAAQTVTISNTGSAAASVSSIAASGAFAETNTCGSSIAAGASCTASVTFKPTAAGSASGSLTVSSNATNPTLTVGLSGTGTSAATATLTASPTSVSFGSETVGSTSAAQTVTISNTGSAAASVSSIAAGAPFAETNTCGSSIAAGASCTASVTFKPTATGSASGGLTVSSNATDSTLTVALSGTGTSAATATLTASPTSVAFGSEAVGSTTGAQTVTITNTGSAAASVSSISAGAPFAETNTCGSSIAAGGSCTASVTFAPTAAGAASGNLTVSSNATNSTLTVALSGTGTSGGGTTNLALNAPITASSYTQTYVASNADDGNTSTYWEGTNGAWPTTLAVNLGASDSLSSVVLDLPPSTSWGTRTQTLSVLGSTNGSSYTTLVGSATYTFNPSTGNTVTIALPSGTTDQYVELSFTANNVQNGAQLSEIQVMGTGTAHPDLALNAAVSASSYTQTYTPSNTVDGNTSTYWEGTNGAWPTTLSVNLGSSQALGSVVLDLPPSTSWGTRTQTLSVLGSTNGSSYTTLVGSATYTFNPATGNTVTIALPSGTTDQYVELSFTANNVQNGAQLSELDVYGP
jgi:Pectate lyase superfamily protein/F5/8 type C domain/Abnormal spindle-like microcephaly-assoc'd, ASPM-SPD-2-Hydin